MNSQDSQEILLFLSENVLIKFSSGFQERLPLKKIKSLEERLSYIQKSKEPHLHPVDSNFASNTSKSMLELQKNSNAASLCFASLVL